MLSAECFVIVLLIMIYLVHVFLKVKAYLRGLGFDEAGAAETGGSPMRVNNDDFYRRIIIGSKIRDTL